VLAVRDLDIAGRFADFRDEPGKSGRVRHSRNSKIRRGRARRDIPPFTSQCVSEINPKALRRKAKTAPVSEDADAVSWGDSSFGDRWGRQPSYIRK
jgi:hypothetical protein